MSLTQQSVVLVCCVLLLLPPGSLSAFLGCPDDYTTTAEDTKTQLELEEYFVGHALLPFFKPIDQFLDDSAATLGLQSNQFRYILGMVAMYPLALVHRLLPNIPLLKHIYTLAAGLFASLYCFGTNTAVPLCTAIFVFLLLKITFGSDSDKSYIKSKAVPVIYFALGLAVVSGVHIYRLIIDYGGYTLDVSGPHMVVTIKLCQIVWNVFDFRNRNKEYQHRDHKSVDIKDLHLIPFLAWIFFFPGFLAGPAFEYRRYMDFTELRHEYDISKRPSIAASLPAAGKCFLTALVMMGITVGVASRFPVNWMLCDGFANLAFPLQVLYLNFSTSLLRPKYYVAWSLSDGSCCLAGIGYDSKKKKWNAVTNFRFWKIEFGESIREAVNNWNVNTSIWLRVYVYERALESKLSSLAATALAFMTSAFWHGFYGGYYILFFFVGVFVQPLAKDLRRHLRPYLEDQSTGKTPLWYNIGGLILTSLAMNFFASSFGMLSTDATRQVWAVVHYYGLIGTAVVMVIPRALQFVPGHKQRVKQHKDATIARKKAAMAKRT